MAYYKRLLFFGLISLWFLIYSLIFLNLNYQLIEDYLNNLDYGYMHLHGDARTYFYTYLNLDDDFFKELTKLFLINAMPSFYLYVINNHILAYFTMLVLNAYLIIKIFNSNRNSIILFLVLFGSNSLTNLSSINKEIFAHTSILLSILWIRDNNRFYLFMAICMAFFVRPAFVLLIITICSRFIPRFKFKKFSITVLIMMSLLYPLILANFPFDKLLQQDIPGFSQLASIATGYGLFFLVFFIRIIGTVLDGILPSLSNFNIYGLFDSLLFLYIFFIAVKKSANYGKLLIFIVLLYVSLSPIFHYRYLGVFSILFFYIGNYEMIKHDVSNIKK